MAECPPAKRRKRCSREHDILHHRATAVMAECPPAKQKKRCSDEHLLVISEKIARWRNIAPYLHLTEAEEVEILESYPQAVPAQRHAMLRKWKQKLGAKATYMELGNVFRSCGRQDLVVKISELLTEDSSSSSGEASCAVKFSLLFII